MSKTYRKGKKVYRQDPHKPDLITHNIYIKKINKEIKERKYIQRSQ